MRRYAIPAIMVGVGFFVVVWNSGCSSGGSTQQHDPVTISPKSADLVVLSQSQQQFQAFIQGSSSTSVNWLVDGVAGGNSTVGVISSNGLYVPPNEVPSGSITVTAQSLADPSQSDSATVTLQYPAAAATSVTPPTIEQGSGATTVTVTGGPFSDAAVVYVGGNPLPSEFISTTEVSGLIPQGSLSVPTTLLLGVENPAPGGGGSNGTMSSNSIALYVVEGSWVRVGDLNTARKRSAAALLPGGKVLVTGGTDADGNVLSSTEIFDPQTNTFSVAGSMTVARSGHSAVTLSNGKILIAGGDPNPTTAEVYDPANGTSTATPAMNFAHTNIAILLTNGQVLLEDWGQTMNGFQFPLNAEVYDATSNTFSAITTGVPPECGGLDPGMCGCLGGGILGSRNVDYVGVPYYFDPSNLSFTNADPSGVASQLSGCTVTTLLNGNVFTTGAGFDTSSIVNAQAKIWNPTNDTVISFPREGFPESTAPVRLQSGKVLVVAGVGDQILDPSMPQLLVAPLPLFQHSQPPTAILLQDGRVLVVGEEEKMTGALTTAAETYLP